MADFCSLQHHLRWLSEEKTEAVTVQPQFPVFVSYNNFVVGLVAFDLNDLFVN